MNQAEAVVVIQRARAYASGELDAEFTPSYDDLLEAAAAMLAVRLDEASGPGRCTDNGWEMTEKDFGNLRDGVEHAMGRSCPYSCTGEVKLWKIAALFGYIDRHESKQRLEVLAKDTEVTP